MAVLSRRPSERLGLLRRAGSSEPGPREDRNPGPGGETIVAFDEAPPIDGTARSLDPGKGLGRSRHPLLGRLLPTSTGLLRGEVLVPFLSSNAQDGSRIESDALPSKTTLL